LCGSPGELNSFATTHPAGASASLQCPDARLTYLLAQCDRLIDELIAAKNNPPEAKNNPPEAKNNPPELQFKLKGKIS